MNHIVFVFAVVVVVPIYAACPDTPSLEVKKVLHNWMLPNVSQQLIEFENWVCQNDDAITEESEALEALHLECSKDMTKEEINSMVCKYNTVSAHVNQGVRAFYANITNDSSLTDPNFDIWSLFRDFPDNRVGVLCAFDKLVCAAPNDEIAQWVGQNKDCLTDIKAGFLQAYPKLKAIEGFYFEKLQ